MCEGRAGMPTLTWLSYLSAILASLRSLHTSLCPSSASPLCWSLHHTAPRHSRHSSIFSWPGSGTGEKQGRHTRGKRNIDCSSGLRSRDKMTEHVFTAFIRNLFHSALESFW